MSHLRADTKEFRELMQRAGYTQAQLAAELDVTDRQIRYWWSGQKPVWRMALLAMRHLVNCKPNDEGTPS